MFGESSVSGTERTMAEDEEERIVAEDEGEDNTDYTYCDECDQRFDQYDKDLLPERED